jgi:hypothetical protein
MTVRFVLNHRFTQIFTDSVQRASVEVCENLWFNPTSAQNPHPDFVHDTTARVSATRMSSNE